MPDAARMAYYRALSSASTQRFMASAFVKQTLAALPNQDIQQHDQIIPVRNGEVRVRIYRPQSSYSKGRPVTIMSHGGGWCLGGLDTEVFTCQLLCRSLDLIVVDVEYRLCPEFQYPSPVLDVYDAVKWVGLLSPDFASAHRSKVSANSATFGGDLTKGFMLCGVSGGGNLTTGVTYLARDEKLQPRLTGSILMCTGMPHEASDSHGNHIDLYPGRCPSWEENANAPISSRKTNQCYGGMLRSV